MLNLKRIGNDNYIDDESDDDYLSQMSGSDSNIEVDNETEVSISCGIDVSHKRSCFEPLDFGCPTSICSHCGAIVWTKSPISWITATNRARVGNRCYEHIRQTREERTLVAKGIEAARVATKEGFCSIAFSAIAAVGEATGAAVGEFSLVEIPEKGPLKADQSTFMDDIALGLVHGGRLPPVIGAIAELNNRVVRSGPRDARDGKTTLFPEFNYLTLTKSRTSLWITREPTESRYYRLRIQAKGDARTDTFKKVKVSSSTSTEIVELETDATSIFDKQEKKEHWLQRVLRQQGWPQKKYSRSNAFPGPQQLERQPEQQLESNSSLETDFGGIESWNSSLDCCQWDLVTCNPRSPSRNVVTLDIYSFVTSLAPEVVVNSAVLAPLFPITTLMKLDISSNSIQGELPPNGIVNFTKLLHLDLRENSFNGSIPTKLFRLQRLRYLDMNSNMFNGILSQEVRALWNLRVLNLAENFLYGEIPMEIGK
ncbi:hypothetical protein IFM89_005727 [Coptis chinensis]|uniref:Leucine-rich repeat-containing N-terminal plant-type domain-containing protein n=1 Tax=Coptis chinensis TaxID=261450 RepID=A0A835IM98_9MAGN|nr:hypothetical protein IFM89_005727 [Coptis chinensis]